MIKAEQLTSDQRIVLSLIHDDMGGGWRPGCGIRLKNDTYMARVIESLVRLGLADRDADWATTGGYGLTRDGFEIASEMH